MSRAPRYTQYPVGHAMNPRVLRVPRGMVQVAITQAERHPKFVPTQSGSASGSDA